MRTEQEIQERIVRREADLERERDPGMRVLKRLLIEELLWVLGCDVKALV